MENLNTLQQEKKMTGDKIVYGALIAFCVLFLVLGFIFSR